MEETYTLATYYIDSKYEYLSRSTQLSGYTLHFRLVIE